MLTGLSFHAKIHNFDVDAAELLRTASKECFTARFSCARSQTFS